MAHFIRDLINVANTMGMRRPGIEPGPQPWQGRIVPLNHRRLNGPAQTFAKIRTGDIRRVKATS